jgi:hypothetical protein
VKEENEKEKGKKSHEEWKGIGKGSIPNANWQWGCAM